MYSILFERLLENASMILNFGESKHVWLAEATMWFSFNTVTDANQS